LPHLQRLEIDREPDNPTRRLQAVHALASNKINADSDIQAAAVDDVDWWSGAGALGPTQAALPGHAMISSSQLSRLQA